MPLPSATRMALRDSAYVSRSGYSIRSRLKAATSRLGAYVGDALTGQLEDDDTANPKPSPYTEERCLVFVGLLMTLRH